MKKLIESGNYELAFNVLVVSSPGNGIESIRSMFTEVFSVSDEFNEYFTERLVETMEQLRVLDENLYKGTISAFGSVLPESIYNQLVICQGCGLDVIKNCICDDPVECDI